MWKKLCIIFFIFVILQANIATAFDEEIAHPKIVDAAIKNKKSTLVNYLSRNLGNEFSKDYDTLIKGKKVIDWMKQGSTEEDASSIRPSNHFHDPTKLWNSSAMSDEPLWLDIVWATGQQYGGSTVAPRNNQTMGWDNARNYFYLALTSTDRENNFAKTFQALGQTMHLLQDMAVPAHVRNDFKSHLTFHGFTSWNLKNWYSNPFEHYVKNQPKEPIG